MHQLLSCGLSLVMLYSLGNILKSFKKVGLKSGTNSQHVSVKQQKRRLSSGNRELTFLCLGFLHSTIPFEDQFICIKCAKMFIWHLAFYFSRTRLHGWLIQAGIKSSYFLKEQIKPKPGTLRIYRQCIYSMYIHIYIFNIV